MDILKHFNVTRFEGKLKNNIRVVLFYRPYTPITTHAVLYSGSKNDPETTLGLAHFVEHMIVNGSANFPSKDVLAEHIESVGGIYEASTGQYTMLLKVEVSDKEDYSRVVDIFNATLCEPLMNKNVFENEKNVVIKEIQRVNSNPTQVLTNTIRKLFFTGTPFEHAVVGTENSIDALEYDDFISEYKKLLDKTRITFVASGDILLNELLDYLNSLSFIESNSFNKNNNDFNVRNKKRILVSFLDIPQTYIYFGICIKSISTIELLHLDILGQILAGGRASRLTKRLRYKKGLVYNVSFNKQGGQDFMAWGINTDTTEQKVQDVINEIVQEFKDIKEEGIKATELEFVKNKIIKSLKRNMQTSNDWVKFHELSEVFLSQPYDINFFIKQTHEATVEDIQKIIEKYFQLNEWQLALCGRTKIDSINIDL